MKNVRRIIRTPHFWIIIVITSFLVFIYHLWPWREWFFNSGIWQFLTFLSRLYPLAVLEFRFHFVGILFILPIIYAAIVYKWQGAVIVTAAALIYPVWILLTRSQATVELWLTNIGLLLLPTALVVAISIELELRRRERMVFMERERERQTYLDRVVDARENERQRLAQELHDDTIQTLLAVASYAEALESPDENNMAEMKRKAGWIKKTTRNAMEDLHRICIDLRPSVLDDLGLISALRWLTKSTNTENNVKVTLDIKGLNRRLSPELEVAIFRVVQEALSNIKRHSNAKEAVIVLEVGAKSFTIMIRDDGKGFIPPQKLTDLVTEGKLGLIGIHERIKALGGTLEIHTAPACGTKLSIEIQA